MVSQQIPCQVNLVSQNLLILTVLTVHSSFNKIIILLPNIYITVLHILFILNVYMFLPNPIVLLTSPWVRQCVILSLSKILFIP
jgi:hypothetical protein